MRGVFHSINDQDDWTDVKGLEEKHNALKDQMAAVEKAAERLVNQKNSQPRYAMFPSVNSAAAGFA